MNRTHLMISLAAHALLASLLTAEDPQKSSDDIWSLVKRSQAAAETIQLDGDKSDWGPLAGFQDVKNESIEDSSRDIQRVSIAPAARSLFVLIETVGEPSREHQAFWLDVDLFGHKEADVRIGIGSDGRHKVKTFNEKENSGIKSEFETLEIESKVGNVVEIRIPYSVLDKVLSQRFTTDPNVNGFRPFVRVNAFTWDAVTREFPDLGPSIASYHLLDRRYELDSKLPGDREAPIAIAFPFSEMHFIGNGALGLRGHVGRYAYDFYITDVQLEAATNQRSPVNEDYFTWGRTVMAPVKGSIVKAVDEHEDLPPLAKQNKRGNEIQIRTDEGFIVSLYHLQQGSVVIEEGDTVEVGRLLGRVGNSGISGWPHIHLTMQRNNLPSEGLPIALNNIIVGLNPQEEDPWKRTVNKWTIREGYFVQPLVE